MFSILRFLLLFPGAGAHQKPWHDRGNDASWWQSIRQFAARAGQPWNHWWFWFWLSEHWHKKAQIIAGTGLEIMFSSRICQVKEISLICCLWCLFSTLFQTQTVVPPVVTTSSEHQQPAEKESKQTPPFSSHSTDPLRGLTATPRADPNPQSTVTAGKKITNPHSLITLRRKCMHGHECYGKVR